MKKLHQGATVFFYYYCLRLRIISHW